MEKETTNICPICQGKKIIAGVCECSTEWRGTQGENEWEECQCSQEEDCPTCQGTGEVTSGK